MGWRGFNCTIPHKVAVIDHLDRLSPAAEAIRFYEEVFGATVVSRMDAPDGTVPHAELDLGDGRL